MMKTWVTSEAFVANGNLTVKARDELPATSVARLLQMSALGAQLGSGSHLVGQATGFMTSTAVAGFGAKLYHRQHRRHSGKG